MPNFGLDSIERLHAQEGTRIPEFVEFRGPMQSCSARLLHGLLRFGSGLGGATEGRNAARDGEGVDPAGNRHPQRMSERRESEGREAPRGYGKAS